MGAFEFPAGYVVVGSDHLYVYRQGAPEQPAWEVPLAYPAGVHTLEVLRLEKAQALGRVVCARARLPAQQPRGYL